jgi:NAD(P)-dependent dehydrogenase (short-subunit alcohol dehydrogenase family)
MAVALDVTSPSQAHEVVASAVGRFGSLDVVVNNAGYATTSSVEDFPEDEFRAQIEANLFGVINVTRAALPVLRGRRSGHFVQISSIGGRVGGTPGLSAYQTAKFAVEGFSEVLANEVAPLGIKVTIAEPGGIRTGWAAGAARASGRISADYEQTVGKWLEMFAGYSGNEPGDPARMAWAIIGAVGAQQPPRRLLLGSDALEGAVAAEEARIAEARKWAEVSRSTDFPTAS